MEKKHQIFSANCRVKWVLASSMHTQAVSTNKHPARKVHWLVTVLLALVVAVLLALVVAVLLVHASVKSSVVTVLQESKASI